MSDSWALDGQVDCRLETVKRLLKERDLLLSLLKRVPLVLRGEAPDEVMLLTVAAEALIRRVEGT